MPGGPGAPATPLSPCQGQTDITICKGLANPTGLLIWVLRCLLCLLVSRRSRGSPPHPGTGRRGRIKTRQWTLPHGLKNWSSSSRHTFSPFCPGGPGKPVLPESPCKQKVSVYQQPPLPRRHAGGAGHAGGGGVLSGRQPGHGLVHDGGRDSTQRTAERTDGSQGCLEHPGLHTHTHVSLQMGGY